MLRSRGSSRTSRKKRESPEGLLNHRSTQEPTRPREGVSAVFQSQSGIQWGNQSPIGWGYEPSDGVWGRLSSDKLRDLRGLLLSDCSDGPAGELTTQLTGDCSVERTNRGTRQESGRVGGLALGAGRDWVARAARLRGGARAGGAASGCVESAAGRAALRFVRESGGCRVLCRA